MSREFYNYTTTVYNMYNMMIYNIPTSVKSLFIDDGLLGVHILFLVPYIFRSIPRSTPAPRRVHEAITTCKIYALPAAIATNANCTKQKPLEIRACSKRHYNVIYA